MDVWVQDHLIAAGGTILSMVERGLLRYRAVRPSPAACWCEVYARGASASTAPSALGSRLTDQWPPCSCRGASRS